MSFSAPTDEIHLVYGGSGVQVPAFLNTVRGGMPLLRPQAAQPARSQRVAGLHTSSTRNEIASSHSLRGDEARTAGQPRAVRIKSHVRS